MAQKKKKIAGNLAQARKTEINSARRHARLHERPHGKPHAAAEAEEFNAWLLEMFAEPLEQAKEIRAKTAHKKSPIETKAHGKKTKKSASITAKA